mmetsp:Transcript_13151/g.35644  ORF Transcript_13151/g.35644 Transcript_13151/m.35644 type:complete len:300 (-) Transcript_13151:240-1139(-)
MQGVAAAVRHRPGVVGHQGPPHGEGSVQRAGGRRDAPGGVGPARRHLAADAGGPRPAAAGEFHGPALGGQDPVPDVDAGRGRQGSDDQPAAVEEAEERAGREDRRDQVCGGLRAGHRRPVHVPDGRALQNIPEQGAQAAGFHSRADQPSGHLAPVLPLRCGGVPQLQGHPHHVPPVLHGDGRGRAGGGRLHQRRLHPQERADGQRVAVGDVDADPRHPACAHADARAEGGRAVQGRAGAEPAGRGHHRRPLQAVPCRRPHGHGGARRRLRRRGGQAAHQRAPGGLGDLADGLRRRGRGV